MGTEDASLRILIFGSSGHGQFSLTESVLQKLVFNDPQTKVTTKTCGSLFMRNVTLVNTPNLIEHDFFHDVLKKEVKKAVCFSCPGPHAILFTLNPLDMPQNAYDVFEPVVHYFGENIWNHTMIVLYDDKDELEGKVKENKHFGKLLEKCGQRYHLFSRKQDENEGNVIRELFQKIDKMVEGHGIFSNLEFKDAEKRIKTEEKIIQNQRKKEVSARLEELKKYSREDLEREVKCYEEKIRLENRERAEVQVAERLGFTLRLVDYAAAIGKGAFAGVILGVPMGFPGIAIGGSVGAVLGGLLGGAAGAVWNMITNALADFGRNAI